MIVTTLPRPRGDGASTVGVSDSGGRACRDRQVYPNHQTQTTWQYLQAFERPSSARIDLADDQKLKESINAFHHSNPSDEALYARIAREIGLNVAEPSVYAEGVLIIPRFDRTRSKTGKIVRLGQESLVATIGVAEFGYIGTHEAYLDSLRKYSADPVADTVEYLKHDIANLALGNPDKRCYGTRLLSPLRPHPV